MKRGTRLLLSLSLCAVVTTLALVVTAPGTYRWVVSYSGDNYNDGSATTCGDETHTIIVGDPQP